MGRSRRGKGPSDPQDILQRRAAAREEARRIAASPGEWGVDPQVLTLPSANEVEAVRDHRNRIIAARRADVFDLLHATRTVTPGGALRRGLSDDQHRAARRLIRDYGLRAGVRDDDEALPVEKIDRTGDPGGLTQAMLAAAERVEAALADVGRVNACVLHHLVAPMFAGELHPWREVVARLTGENDRNAQAALVRQACESLRQCYEAWDERAERAQGTAPRERVWRPFSSFGHAA